MASRTGYLVPWTDANPTTVPSPTPVVIPPGTATCAPSDLTAKAGWQGAGGSMAGWLDLTDVSQHPCVVNGSPRLIQLQSDTTILTQVTYQTGKDAGPGDETGAAGPLLLQPGDQAGAFLSWTNWCPAMIPVVTSLVVTLPTGGSPLIAGPTSPGPGLFGTPRCDVPDAGSTFTAYAFVPVAPPEPPYEPQAVSVDLSVPYRAAAGSDLFFFVTLTNLGGQPAVLDPCPSYTEDLIVGGNALKPPAPQQFLLNCADLGDAIPAGGSVTLQMHYAVPSGVAPGVVQLVWGVDPGGPLDASTAVDRAWLTVTAG